MKPTLYRSLLLGLLVLVCAGRLMADGNVPPVGTQVDTGTLSGPPEITSGNPHLLPDFVFYIVSLQREKDGNARIRATGRYKGTAASFDVVLGKRWPLHPAPKEIPGLRLRSGRVIIQSTGRPSDTFLRALVTAYGVKAKSVPMAPHTDWVAAVFEGNPANIAAAPIKSKLFFESPDGKLYAEIFFNLDLKQRRLELAEKDIEYRQALVQIFSAPAKVNDIDVDGPLVPVRPTEDQMRRAGFKP